jgi:GTP-binding protein
MIDYLRQTNRPLIVVATKADRVGTRIHASLNALRKAHGVDSVLPYSAKTGLGQDELWKRLRSAGAMADASGESA